MLLLPHFLSATMNVVALTYGDEHGQSERPSGNKTHSKWHSPGNKTAHEPDTQGLTLVGPLQSLHEETMNPRPPCIRPAHPTPFLHPPPSFSPLPPNTAPSKSKGYRRSKTICTAPTPESLHVKRHNIQKKCPDSFTLHHLSVGIGVQLLQEINTPPSVQRANVFGGCSLKCFYNIPKSKNANGRAIVFLPEFAPYAEAYDLHDPEGWLCAATLSLPAYPPVLILSVHVPHNKRPEVEALLVPLPAKNPHYILGGDFNAVPCPVTDLHRADDEAWHWLCKLVTASDPLIIDTCRMINPTTTEFTRYSTDNRPSCKRIDFILASPSLLPHAPLLGSSMDTQDRSSDNHPVLAIFDIPSPIPFPPPAPA